MVSVYHMDNMDHFGQLAYPRDLQDNFSTPGICLIQLQTPMIKLVIFPFNKHPTMSFQLTLESMMHHQRESIHKKIDDVPLKLTWQSSLITLSKPVQGGSLEYSIVWLIKH